MHKKNGGGKSKEMHEWRGEVLGNGKIQDLIVLKKGLTVVSRVVLWSGYATVSGYVIASTAVGRARYRLSMIYTSMSQTGIHLIISISPTEAEY